MEELVNTLVSQMKDFMPDATANAIRGNKAAGLRARKLSLHIEKNLKAFRKQSRELSATPNP